MNLYVPEIAETEWQSLSLLQDFGILLNPRALVLANSFINTVEFMQATGTGQLAMMQATQEMSDILGGITERPSDEAYLEAIGGTQGVIGGGTMRRKYLDGAFLSNNMYKWLPAVGMDMNRAGRLMMFGGDEDIIKTLNNHRSGIMSMTANWVEGEFPVKLFTVAKKGRASVKAEKAAVKMGLHLSNQSSYGRAFAAVCKSGRKVGPNIPHLFRLWPDKRCLHFDDPDVAMDMARNMSSFDRDVLVFDNTRTSDVGLNDSPYEINRNRWIIPNQEQQGIYSFDPWDGVDNLPVPPEILAMNVYPAMYSVVVTVGQKLRFVEYDAE